MDGIPLAHRMHGCRLCFTASPEGVSGCRHCGLLLCTGHLAEHLDGISKIWEPAPALRRETRAA
jgi:hypothetical protein